MTNPGLTLINVSFIRQFNVMTVPVGPSPRGGPIPTPNVQFPYDILYICTGVIAFEGDDSFHSNNGEITGVLTMHALDERAGVPIFKQDGQKLELVSPNTGQPMTILDSAITVSLARINNIDSDNGIWTFDEADVLPPEPNSNVPEMHIQLKIRGDGGIKLERVAYTAFIQTSSVT